jgi:hypothetical protein
MFSELTTGGIVFVALAWGTVGSLLTYCLFKVYSGETDLEKAAKIKEAKMAKKNQ